MNIWKGLRMLFARRNTERKPDALRAQMTIALQANERAGENARAALMEVLENSDRVRGARR